MVKEAPAEFKIDLNEDWGDLDWKTRLHALKNTVSVPEVFELMTGEEVPANGKVRSPSNPEDHTPSCHLYDDHFFDYSTGKGGDIFDLAVALNPAYTLHTAVVALKQKAVRVGKEYGDVERVEPAEIDDFFERLDQYTRVESFHGLDVHRFGVRVTPEGDVLVPHQEMGRVYGVKTRFAGGGKGSWAGSQFSHRLYDPCGWPPRNECGSLAIICEGESDAWAMIGAVPYESFHGVIDVLALPCGAGTWKDHWLDDLGGYNVIHICMDNDDAGKRARDKIMLKVGYGRAEELKVPQLYNDARAAITAGWVPFA